MVFDLLCPVLLFLNSDFGAEKIQVSRDRKDFKKLMKA
jgi:hypothetical protein